MTSDQRRTIVKLGWLFIFSITVAAALAASFVLLRNMQEQTRGVTYGVVTSEPAPIGVNISMEQYSDDDVARAYALICSGGFRLVRQHFYWSDIEPRPGEFQWDKSDRIVEHARKNGISLIAVLDTTPTWARDPGEADLRNAAPADVQDYARFVQAFVRRYGDIRVSENFRLYVQLWDNPNIHPFWGRRNADPTSYTALLRAGAAASRLANPEIKIISAGLAPNRELIRGHPDYSDVLFLRGMYEAGASEYFDILGAKPYGMWTGPEDRRVSMDVLNWSRVILLREEMVAHDDGAKPVWAVEFGWNALPLEWQGKPSPWGTDEERVQADRLVQSVQRARSEWNWMGALVAQTFRPTAPLDDPIWGFALVGIDWKPRGLFEAAKIAVTQTVLPASFDWLRFYATLAGAIVLGLAAAWRGVVEARYIRWADAWDAVQRRFAALPQVAQVALLAGLVAAFYYSRNAALNLLLLGLIVALVAFRIDLGLAITVFAIPFYLLPKNLFGSMQFSLVEILTLATVVAWGIERVLSYRPPAGDSRQPTADRATREQVDGRLPSTTGLLSSIDRLRSAAGKRTALDWAVLLFVAIGILSVGVASNFGVASREFRVIVLEPALLYALVRITKLTWSRLRRLVDALVMSAVAVSLIGLYQFFFTDYVIVGEGVRRVLAVYGSPNNLALFLERVLPLVIALALFSEDKKRQLVYALAVIPVAACAYLTFSRGTWLLGLPAALLFIGLLSGRRARLTIAGLVIVGGIALIPFLGTNRARSLFETGTGTGFFRVSVWESGLAMLRDHPVFGVGLDNFLYEYDKYIKPEAWREPNLSHPHNILLDFWLRTGVLGAGVMLWMVLQFYRKGMSALGSRTSRPLALGLMAGMTAALAHGLIDAAYFYVDLAYIWMLMLGLIETRD